MDEAKVLDELGDEQFLLYAYRGNQHAVSLALMLRNVSHTLDDLVDGDKPITNDRVVEAFWDAMIRLPANPFFVEHALYLRPLMTGALVNWQIANVYERVGGEERNIAHSLRYDLATVLVMMAYVVGGRQWAEKVGPEIRKRCQREPLADYLKECAKRFDKKKGESDGKT